MKKVLLLTLGLAASMAANAYTEPTEYPDYSWQGVAPNGTLAVSELNGAMAIVDLVSGTESYYEDPDWVLFYSGGLGNYVSNTGIVVGNICSTGPANYWQGGEWHDLDSHDTAGGSIANGITPDGSRICGNLMMEVLSVDAENIMVLPCYWEATADGFGEYHILPHPTIDLTGRTPQYITAIAISADGKTIVGQITDYTGFIHQPIIFTEGADGEWAYSLPGNDLFHPEGIVLPEWPGEYPKQPQPDDYMTEEEKAAYQQAISDYWSGVIKAYPKAVDFLSEEGKAAYEADLAEWQVVYDEWAPKNDAFSEAFDELLLTVPDYEFNSVFVTPNGQKYVTSSAEMIEDPDSWFGWSTVYAPTIIDLTTDEVTNVDTAGENWQVCDVPNDEVIFLCNGIQELVPQGWILKEGVATPVEEWLASESEEMADWIENNLTHEIITGYQFDEETGEYIVDEDGNMVVDGDIQAVSVYDLQGRQVLNSNANGAISNNLPAGIYVVRAQTGANCTVTSKIRK